MAVAIACVLAASSGCKEKGTIKVTKFTIEGAQRVPAAQIKAVLATRESSRLPWGTKRYFDRARFDADLKRIVAFYADRGYPDARVRSVDVKMNDDQTAVALTVVVDEGQPVIVDRVDVNGLDVLNDRVRARTLRKLPLQSGSPLDRQLFAATRDTLTSALKDHGYPWAKVQSAEAPSGSDPRRVVVTYSVDPGSLARFGQIEVVGNSSVGDDIVLRQLAFKPGDLFRSSRVQESQTRLYNLELFQFANVTQAHVEGQPVDVPMRVVVAEGKHRRLNFGVGYGTESKARADFRWANTNFYGGARTLDFTTRWSSIDRGVKVDLTQPYFLTSHLSLGFSGQAWNASEPAYTTSTYGGRVTLTHRANQFTSYSAAFVSEYERTAATEEALAQLTFEELIALGLDPTDGKQKGTRIGFEFDAQHTNVRNLLDARRGYLIAGHAEQSGGWLPGTYNYYTVSGDARYFLPVGKPVVATRLQWGSIDAIGSSQSNGLISQAIPFSKRFFLGGSTSLRGWGRLNVSPLTEKGQPIGGQSLFQWTTELRYPLSPKLSAVAFFDAGNVWIDPWKVHLGDLRYDVGPGVRYRTPIGPIRVDVGYQLNPIPGLLVNGEPEKRQWHIHFSIGQAF